MKFDDAMHIAEEGGTIVLYNGERMYNASKSRDRTLKASSEEYLKYLKEKSKLDKLVKLGSEDAGKRLKLVNAKLKAIHNERVNAAKGNPNEYIVTDTPYSKDKKVDSFYANDMSANSFKNWKERMTKEKEISDRLNKQNTKKKFSPR